MGSFLKLMSSHGINAHYFSERNSYHYIFKTKPYCNFVTIRNALRELKINVLQIYFREIIGAIYANLDAI